jgi:outer membrane protein assembly factor BamB
LTRTEGKVRWLTELPTSSRWSGPVLAGGKLWLISADGLLVGVNATTGEVVTKLDFDTKVFVSPIVAGGRMYILTDSANLIALN